MKPEQHRSFNPVNNKGVQSDWQLKDIGNVVETYSPGTKTETLVLHAGHNSIDKGLSVQDAAMQMKDTVE